MAMRMLDSAGLEILTDGVRTADTSNPHGYYEFEPVKRLHESANPSWLTGAKGKVVKVVSFFLAYLPQRINYRVIFMHRDLDEIILSQDRMLLQRGERKSTDHGRIREHYQLHLEKIRFILDHRPCFASIGVSYADAIADPAIQAARINAFLGGRLDVRRMTSAVDDRLYRTRLQSRSGADISNARTARSLWLTSLTM